MNDESPQARILREQIEKWEKEIERLTERVADWRNLLVKETTGKPAPSPNSTASRIGICIKARLSQGPATFEEVLTYLLEQQSRGKVIIKGDPRANTKRSLGKSVDAGTIVQDGELYRLP